MVQECWLLSWGACHLPHGACLGYALVHATQKQPMLHLLLLYSFLTCVYIISCLWFETEEQRNPMHRLCRPPPEPPRSGPCWSPSNRPSPPAACPLESGPGRPGQQQSPRRRSPTGCGLRGRCGRCLLCWLRKSTRLLGRLLVMGCLGRKEVFLLRLMCLQVCMYVSPLSTYRHFVYPTL